MPDAQRPLHLLRPLHALLAGARHPCTIWSVDWAVGGMGPDELAPMVAARPQRASRCSACGLCLERCPFVVDILHTMRRAAVLFETV